MCKQKNLPIPTISKDCVCGVPVSNDPSSLHIPPFTRPDLTNGISTPDHTTTDTEVEDDLKIDQQSSEETSTILNEVPVLIAKLKVEEARNAVDVLPELARMEEDMEGKHCETLEKIDQQLLELGPFAKDVQELIIRGVYPPLCEPAPPSTPPPPAGSGRRSRRPARVSSAGQRTGRKSEDSGSPVPLTSHAEDGEKPSSVKRGKWRKVGSADSQRSSSSKDKGGGALLDPTTFPSIIPAASDQEMLSLYLPDQRGIMDSSPSSPANAQTGPKDSVDVRSPPHPAASLTSPGAGGQTGQTGSEATAAAMQPLPLRHHPHHHHHNLAPTDGHTPHSSHGATTGTARAPQPSPLALEGISMQESTRATPTTADGQLTTPATQVVRPHPQAVMTTPLDSVPELQLHGKTGAALKPGSTTAHLTPETPAQVTSSAVDSPHALPRHRRPLPSSPSPSPSSPSAAAHVVAEGGVAPTGGSPSVMAHQRDHHDSESPLLRHRIKRRSSSSSSGHHSLRRHSPLIDEGVGRVPPSTVLPSKAASAPLPPVSDANTVSNPPATFLPGFPMLPPATQDRDGQLAGSLAGAPVNPYATALWATTAGDGLAGEGGPPAATSVTTIPRFPYTSPFLNPNWLQARAGPAVMGGLTPFRPTTAMFPALGSFIPYRLPFAPAPQGLKPAGAFPGAVLTAGAPQPQSSDAQPSTPGAAAGFAAFSQAAALYPLPSSQALRSLTDTSNRSPAGTPPVLQQSPYAAAAAAASTAATGGSKEEKGSPGSSDGRAADKVAAGLNWVQAAAATGMMGANFPGGNPTALPFPFGLMGNPSAAAAAQGSLPTSLTPFGSHLAAAATTLSLSPPSRPETK